MTEHSMVKGVNTMEICEALRLTRNESGRSQEYMSFELGVSRRTIQNWEMGISEPSISQCVNWFRITGKNPISYLLQYLYPNINNMKKSDKDADMKASLLTLINALPPDGIRELLFVLYGDHGSSPRGIINLITAHLQTPLKDRVTQAGVIIHNYEMAKRKGTLARPKSIQPDLEFLKAALKAGENAVIQGDDEYIT